MSQFQQPVSGTSSEQYGKPQQGTTEQGPTEQGPTEQGQLQQGWSQQAQRQQAQRQQPQTQQSGQFQQQRQQQGAGGVQRARMFETTSYLSSTVREQVVQSLNQTLADATVLQTHARFAHWNVRGMSFHGLHETFEDIVEALEAHIDTIGERITALGGQAMGTAGMAVGACRLPQLPADVYTGPQFVEVIVDRLAIFDATLARDIQRASELDDPDTADLLNEVSRDVSKLRWFLEAHLRTQPVDTVGQAPGGTATQTQTTGRTQSTGGTQDVSSAQQQAGTPAAGGQSQGGGQPQTRHLSR